MPRHAFDDLSKAVAARTSRRSLLRGLIGAAAGALALTGRETGAQRGQVGICHKTWAWSSDWRYITVDARDERRIETHLDHGDAINPDFNSDPAHCGGCGNTCKAPENASAFCSGGWCDFACDEGYAWNGSVCEPVSTATCWYWYCQDSCSWVTAGVYDEWYCGVLNQYCETGGSCYEWAEEPPPPR